MASTSVIKLAPSCVRVYEMNGRTDRPSFCLPLLKRDRLSGLCEPLLSLERDWDCDRARLSARTRSARHRSGHVMYFCILPTWLEDDSLKPTTAKGDERSARLTSGGLGEEEAKVGLRRDESCRLTRARVMACFSSGGEWGVLVGIGERGQMGVTVADERGEGFEVVFTVPACQRSCTGEQHRGWQASELVP